MQKNTVLPINLLILNTVGSVLLAVGCIGWLHGDIGGLHFLQLKKYAWQYVLGGVLLTAPLQIHVVKVALHRQKLQKKGAIEHSEERK